MTQQYHVGAHRRAPLIDVRPSKQQRGAPKTKNALNPSETVQPWDNRSAIRVVIGLRRRDAIRVVIRFGKRERSRIWVDKKGSDRVVKGLGLDVRSRGDWVEEKGCDRGVRFGVRCAITFGLG